MRNEKRKWKCKFSFDKTVILKRILIIFKSALTTLLCISNLSVNTVLYRSSIFCRNFLNFGTAFKFCDTKKKLSILSGKSWKLSNQKDNLFEFALNVKVFLKWKRQYFINFCGAAFYVLSWIWIFDGWRNKTSDICFKGVGFFS